MGTMVDISACHSVGRVFPMAENRRGARRLVRRAVGVLLALALLSALAPTAGADIKQQLDQAKARLAQIKQEVEAQQKVLDRLSAQAAVLAQKIDVAQATYEQITAQLQQTRQDLAQASAQLQAIEGQLNARARETYMQGPGSNLEFLLGATSLTDLSDRLEYVDVLTQTDADLANQVQNLRNTLAAKQHEQQRLQAKQADVLNGLQADRAQLDAQFAQQQQIYDSIQSKQAEAERLVKKLGKQYQAFLASLYGLKASNGIFKYCPVQGPHAVYDGFGAPRYAGGYHLHAGNDIIAPLGTPIVAPFDGIAQSSWNTLGGNSVFVYGAAGYVYNAHLDHFSASSDGPVSAGETIGYVGNTGDAQGGVTHDHFEWHPKVIPPDWPKSAYGYSVIGTAVNPYPLLEQVC